MLPAPNSAVTLIGYRYQVSEHEYVYVTAEDAEFTTHANTLVESLHLEPQPGCSKYIEVYLCGRCWMPPQDVGRMSTVGFVPLYLGPKV